MRMRTSLSLLAATAAAAGALAVSAPAASANGCGVWAATDNRAYAQCSNTTRQYRAGAACTLWGLPAGTAYGQWVRNGQVSVADCSWPRRIFLDPSRGPVVFYEMR